jgi:hypothetical protein
MRADSQQEWGDSQKEGRWAASGTSVVSAGDDKNVLGIGASSLYKASHRESFPDLHVTRLS